MPHAFTCNTPHRSPSVLRTRGGVELLRCGLGGLVGGRGVLRGRLLGLLALLGALGGVRLGSVVRQGGEGGGENEGGDQLLHGLWNSSGDCVRTTARCCVGAEQSTERASGVSQLLPGPPRRRATGLRKDLLLLRGLLGGRLRVLGSVLLRRLRLLLGLRGLLLGSVVREGSEGGGEDEGSDQLLHGLLLGVKNSAERQSTCHATAGSRGFSRRGAAVWGNAPQRRLMGWGVFPQQPSYSRLATAAVSLPRRD